MTSLIVSQGKKIIIQSPSVLLGHEACKEMSLLRTASDIFLCVYVRCVFIAAFITAVTDACAIMHNKQAAIHLKYSHCFFKMQLKARVHHRSFVPVCLQFSQCTAPGPSACWLKS